jgi:hypothetical protein
MHRRVRVSAMGYWSETFAGNPECVAAARKFTVHALGAVPGADIVELVASELAANAVLHSNSGEPGGQFTLHVATFQTHFRVRVDDAGGDTEPQSPRGGAGWDECGRGLALVAALSSRWGVLGDRYARAVWAEISIPQDPFAVPDPNPSTATGAVHDRSYELERQATL